jgi:CRISPR-associated protein Cst2
MNKEQSHIEKKHNNVGGRYIVLDVVFYGNSLNYDQGTGNYQELKKITKWDGKQYSFVSKYALRYSILETGKNMGLWNIADAEQLQRAGERDKTVIQPAIKTLLSGEILKYPEFDLFGYLITNTTPQNAREAAVKISHAISLTPYTYDSHFCGNIGLAKRIVTTTGKMDPNLFTVEEHQTYYIYTVVIDVDKIGKNEVYLSKKDGENWKVEVKEDNNTYKIEITTKDKKGNQTETFELKKNNNDVKITKDELENVYLFTQTLAGGDEVVKGRIANLIKSILYLNRNIKGRPEILHPKLLIIGLYKSTPYKSYKDQVALSDEYEEILEEKKEMKENNEIRIIRRVVKLKKPRFVLRDIPTTQKSIELIDQAETTLLFGTNEHSPALSELFSNSESCKKLYIFRAPEVEVDLEDDTACPKKQS